MDNYLPTPNNQIFVKNAFLSDNDCDFICNIIDKQNLCKYDWSPGNNVKCFSIYLNHIDNRDEQVKIDNIIYNKILNFQKELNNIYNINTKGDSGYCLRKIYGETKIHKDGIYSDKILNINNNNYYKSNSIRCLSVIIILNNTFEGCEFHFPNQNVTINPQKGQLIAFPPYWTHPHKVSSPLNNTYRYTINTWLYENNK